MDEGIAGGNELIGLAPQGPIGIRRILLLPTVKPRARGQALGQGVKHRRRGAAGAAEEEGAAGPLGLLGQRFKQVR